MLVGSTQFLTYDWLAIITGVFLVSYNYIPKDYNRERDFALVFLLALVLLLLVPVLIERAAESGYTALCLTVDVPVIGQRERDLRNGFTIPPRVTLQNVLDMAQRLPWLIDVLRGPTVTFRNFADAPGTPGNDAISLGAYVQRLHDPSVTWADLDWFRSVWKGLPNRLRCSRKASH